MRTGEQYDARERNTNVGVRIRFAPCMLHEISLSKFSFKRRREKGREQEEKPSNANADAGAIRFTDVHKYT